MITRFATVYPGHVDFPDMGQTATPANERRYGNEHLATVFAKTDAVARRMDELGYYAIWLAEHHFQHEGYECLPNLLMSAVHLAHITKQIKIGCGFNIAPMWHPLRLAEDFATADILTGGRVIFGVGAASIPERSRLSAHRCSTSPPTASSSKSRSTLSSRRSARSRSRIAANTTRCRRRCLIAAT